MRRYFLSKHRRSSSRMSMSSLLLSMLILPVPESIYDFPTRENVVRPNAIHNLYIKSTLCSGYGECILGNFCFRLTISMVLTPQSKVIDTETAASILSHRNASKREECWSILVLPWEASSVDAAVDDHGALFGETDMFFRNRELSRSCEMETWMKGRWIWM